MTDESVVNTSGLSPGMIVRNYPKMCELLGEKVRGGDSKVAQKKLWSAWFKYEQEGNSFKILEIYDKPLEIVDRRHTKSGKYIKFLEPLLFNVLQSNGRNEKNLVKISYFLEMGLLKQEYYELRNAIQIKYDEYSKSVDCEKTEKEIIVGNQKINPIHWTYFTNLVNNKLYEVWRHLIDAETRRKNIKVITEYTIFRDGECFLPTVEEWHTIEKIKEQCQSHINKKYPNLAFSLCHRNVYFLNLNRTLQQELNCDKVQESLRIKLCNKNEKKKNPTEIKTIIEEFKKTFSSDIQSKIEENYQDFHSTFSGEFRYVEAPEISPYWRILNRSLNSDDFLLVQSHLVDCMLG